MHCLLARLDDLLIFYVCFLGGLHVCCRAYMRRRNFTIFL
jgi:hypothetical protein